jgi:Zn-dependent peptidase ImmA (M78 family)/transcriptional regulator with XRE-family HTH domain
MFSADRLALARRRRGFTKKRLADIAGVTTRAITAFEIGEYPPADETLQRIADALGFPLSFFSGETLEEIYESGVSFRSMKRMTAYQKNSALAAGTLALEISRWVNHRFKLPLSSIPDLRGETPISAARIVRHEWGLGTYSIKNMLHLLESKGVRVFSLFENAREVDAFSMWKDGTPFIFSNRIKSSAHRRFDLAHELAHLTLHKHGAPNGPVAEQEADEFAANFLMPAETVKAVATGAETVNDLIRLKKNWRVSVGALARRLRDTGMVSDWHYRMLCIRISERGFRTSEPEDYPPEQSQVWEKILTSLRDSGMGAAQISSDLSIPPEEVEKLIWGLVTIGVTTPSGPIFRSSKRPNLKLVK